MDKIQENLLKAIEFKASAYKALTIDEIVSLSTALRNIAISEVLQEFKNECGGS